MDKKYIYKVVIFILFILALTVGVDTCKAQTLEEIIQDKYDMNDANNIYINVYNNGCIVTNDIDSVFIYNKMVFGFRSDTLLILFKEY